MLVVLHLNQPSLGDGSRQSVRAAASREPTEHVAPSIQTSNTGLISPGCDSM